MTTGAHLTRPVSLGEWLERLGTTFGPAVAESTERALAYRPQPTDVFISPFAKCGTTWLQQIVHGLRSRGDMNFEDVMQVIPWLEMAHFVGVDLNARQRGGFRAFKSHLTYHEIPKGGRYIVSFRSPKDALLSHYKFVDGYYWEPGAVSLAQYAQTSYLADHRGHKSYWEHLVSWWEQRHNPNVLLLSYEGMKADLPGTVQTIAGFLGLPLDDHLRKLVIGQASLEFMQANRRKFAPTMVQEASARIGFVPPSDSLATVRTGRVGDHRAELDSDIGSALDRIWRDVVEVRSGLSSYEALREQLS